MRTAMTGPAWVAYAQIYVESSEDFHDLGECFGGQHNGLCGAAAAGKLWLVTGLHSGRVGFTVEVHDEAPPLDDSWEEIVEASYRPSAMRPSTVGAAKATGRWAWTISTTGSATAL
jgi:hypothetical protein